MSKNLTDVIKMFRVVVLFLLLSISKVTAFENKILFKVNDKIITSIDILNEINYLNFLNEEFQNLENKKIFEISKNSLIREKIKEINLSKNFEDVRIEEEYFNNLIDQYSKRLGFQNIGEFNSALSQYKIEIETIKRKITIEVLWNKLILNKFLRNVKIDKVKIKKELQSRTKQKEFQLSEILFNLSSNENYSEKLNSIIKTIENENFSKAALIHSISDTSKSGGELGWIKETSLNPKIYKNLKTIKNGDFTKPINTPGGYLILQINDVREIDRKIDIEKEIQIIERQKTNEQLNQFSNLYFNKIMKDIIIDEL